VRVFRDRPPTELLAAASELPSIERSLAADGKVLVARDEPVRVRLKREREGLWPPARRWRAAVFGRIGLTAG
jgi:hypothetical protein